ncbi:MAG TPA: methyltransferase domain-containing protein [Parcubacteria group bacterium]|jgi:ubiquinone/menaquinone biosynthesis C-methylase UbiE|nr:methyltransferase domain-containing protein [Parcubacteria group bacterium]
MKTHFEHLLDVIPDLKVRRILDLGSGKGSFLIQCAQNGVFAKGIELNKGYIETSIKRASDAGVVIDVVQGVGESLPFNDSEFNFVNLCEVIEHVENPNKVLKEVHRVLEKEGLVYISVPNRFGIKDQHFNLYFVNWLPRVWSDLFIGIFSRHKDYTGEAGHQRLSQMHYNTFKGASKIFIETGFKVEDIRLIKIKKYKGLKYHIAYITYLLLKPWYFDSFHFLLKK